MVVSTRDCCTSGQAVYLDRRIVLRGARIAQLAIDISAPCPDRPIRFHGKAVIVACRNCGHTGETTYSNY